MAVVFTKTLSETALIKSFIDNEVYFSSDSPSPAFKCQITVDNDPSFEISPDKDGIFYFNFKRIFSKLIQDFFVDDQAIDIDAGDLTTLVKDYSQIYKLVNITFQVSLANGSTETTSLSVNLIQSTSNFQDRKKQTIQVLDSFGVLNQLDADSNRTFRQAYFKGYPFDIQVYKNVAGNVTITNKNNLDSVVLNLPNKINRIFFSDGEKDVITEDILSLANGMNELEFNTTDLTTIFLEVFEPGCGKYLKWKNGEGGWEYWFFDELTEQVRDVRDKGYIDKESGSLDNNNPIRNIGKESKDSVRIGSINVPSYYRRKLESLVDSPKVYLFMAEAYSADDPTNWLSVKVNNRSFAVSLPKKDIFDLSFDLELPERYNIML